MKIISLNTWGGRAGKEKLLNFFSQYKDEVDIFCLQEIWAAPYEWVDGQAVGGRKLDHSSIMAYGLQEISQVLIDFTPYFRPHFGDHYGLLMFVKNGLKVEVEGEVFVYKERGYPIVGDIGLHERNVQFVTLSIDDSPLTILNFHGLWNGQGKGDSEDRLEQSRKIVNLLVTLDGKKVLCGDFNLLPDTESLGIIERAGMKNLIKEYNITSTRTSLYDKTEKFADYILVSKDVEVLDFKVLPEEVSDHAGLYLEIA